MGLAIAKICHFASRLAELWALPLLSFTCLWNSISCLSCLDVLFPVGELHILCFVILTNQASPSQHVCSLSLYSGCVSAIENTMAAGFSWVQGFLKPCYMDRAMGAAEVSFAMSGWQFSNKSIVKPRLLWISLYVVWTCGSLLTWWLCNCLMIWTWIKWNCWNRIQGWKNSANPLEKYL